GFHSVIESPLSVRRVAPPRMIMPITSAQISSSQRPTSVSCGARRARGFMSVSAAPERASARQAVLRRRRAFANRLRSAAKPRDDEAMKTATRRAIGSLILLAYLPIYVVLAATVGGWLAEAPAWAGIAFFAVAGFAWIFPLYPLFVWMRGPTNKPPAPL